MSVAEQKLREQRDETAALWAARLEGSTLEASARAELENWLAEHPDNRALLSEYCQFSADLEKHLPALVASGSLALPPRNRVSGRRRVLRWLALPALGAAAAVAVIVIRARLAPVAVQSVSTSAAERRSLTLADGTRVELDAQTNLLIEDSPSERRIRLADGEAYFVVTKDRTRPFTVETPTGSVRVTGTTFDVRTVPSAALEVTVVEGSVKVRPGEIGGARTPDPVSLGAGDRLSAGPNGVTVSALTPDALGDALAWREGYVVFDGVPLGEALGRFARYHGRGISSTQAAAKVNIGGRYLLGDLDKFFAEIQNLPEGVIVSSDPLSGTVRVSLRSER